jgi:rhomboid protease GluP
MSLEILLLWTVCLSCLSIFIRALRSPYHRGWSVVSGCILAVTASLASVAPNLAIAIGGSLWGILILLPLLGSARVNKLMYQQRYRDARQLAVCLCWLHPADGWLEQPKLLFALEMGQRGAMKDAIACLQEYQTQQTPFGRNATALLYAMGSYWSELRAWVEQNVSERTLAKEPNLLSYYLRALGETGDLNNLLSQVQRFWPFLEQSGNAIALNWVRMFTFAFCGQSQQVAQLFEKSLSNYSPKIREFWVLTALIASKRQQQFAREKLAALSDPRDALLSSAIAWRLSHPPVVCDRAFTYSSRQILFSLSTGAKQKVSYARALTFIPTKAYATYTLIGINLLFFALEIHLGGSENLATLYQLGAVAPLEVSQGQWWRLINANFLHFGWIHLSTNMLGLYFLGPFVELRLGWARYLMTYLLSGLGTMFAFSLFTLQFDNPEQLLVGASASIMSLIGTTAAILLKGWQVDKSRIAAQRLRWVVSIILIQVVFDFSIPQVSFFAHTSGLILGLILGCLFILKQD